MATGAKATSRPFTVAAGPGGKSPRIAQKMAAAATVTTAISAAIRPPRGCTPEIRTAATSVAACSTVVAKRLASEAGRLIWRATDAITSSRTIP